MKTLIASLFIFASQFAMASLPLEDYPLVKGIVRKINLDTQKVTIKHEEIPNLEMPPMTMVFRVVQPELLNNLKVGDYIHFAAEKIEGSYTILWWESAQH